MEIVPHQLAGKNFAEILSDGLVISSAEDALDLLGNIYFQGFEGMLVYEKNISPEFFDLKNGLAGEVLQKFSNYGIRLAVVGDFQHVTGNSIRDFMLESNQGKRICFVNSREEALHRLEV